MPEKVSVNWLRSATPAWDQIGFVLQFQPRPPISGSFRNHAYVNVAAGPAPGRNWLRFAIPAEGPILGSFRNYAYVNAAPDQDWLRSAKSRGERGDAFLAAALPLRKRNAV